MNKLAMIRTPILSLAVAMVFLGGGNQLAAQGCWHQATYHGQPLASAPAIYHTSYQNPHQMAYQIPQQSFAAAHAAHAPAKVPVRNAAHTPARQMTDSERLVVECYRLSRSGLDYRFGASDPNVAFDCSSATQYILKRLGHSSPRTALEQYRWIGKHNLLRTVPQGNEEAFLRTLAPGHLLFWSGTYSTSKPITHVMVYLGLDRSTGKPIVFGARSSRSKGHTGNGVDFFDLKTKLGARSKLVAAGRIPGFQYPY